MSRTTKIATCCYCGTRAALDLAGRGRHELACSGCGAPLHDLKSLRADAVDPATHSPPRKGRRRDKTGRPAMRREVWEAAQNLQRRKKTKTRKRKNPVRKLLSEAFDLLEDIFD